MLPVKRDPAPSRWKYRMERLWLTPLFRFFMHRGLPALVVGGLIAAVATNPRVVDGVEAAITEARDALAARPELTVERVEVTGAGPDLEARIHASLALDLPASALDLRLDVLRHTVQALEPVGEAHARFGDDNVLHIRVTERVPVAIWQMPDGMTLIDPTGARVDRISSRWSRADLPILAGAGAEDHVPEALRLLQAAAPVADRVRGLVRVGERRWNLILDKELTVLLPEEAPLAALRRVLALHSAKKLLDRDLVRIDLRDDARPVVQMNDGALEVFLSRRLMSNEDDA